MGNAPNADSGEKQSKEYKLFAVKRILMGAIGIVLLLWLGSVALNFFDDSSRQADHSAAPIADAEESHDTQPPAGSGDTCQSRAPASERGPATA